ncbi:T-cell surface glycoprotein CD8 alpha chain [Carettochelys insculpta]|uniref:T-cell surface glycoprotein CD8 alpha chain n=1 Tax=Carettochelys insculpta TaxID=44489 RepID=UPI003EB92126
MHFFLFCCISPETRRHEELMARFVTSLFFLSAILCCCRSQRSKISVRHLSSSSSSPTLGTRVELECVISDSSLADSGVSWIRQHKDSGPQFILFITTLNKVTQAENGNRPARFEARKESRSYILIVKTFQKQDEGSYYCVINRNQMLHFSSGVSLYLPAPTTTTVPSTQAASTQPSSTTQSKEAKDCQHHIISGKAPKKASTNFTCDLYIWVPLAGACLLLFIALLATIIVCQKSRRRRCKCKRPLNGNNGKPSVPNRYV